MRSLNTSKRGILAIALIALTQVACAQVNYGAFDPFTFEGSYITGFYGPSSSYTFKTGNNLQNANTTGGYITPDYHWSPNFGWQIDGYVAQSNTVGNFINPGSGTMSSTYTGIDAKVDAPGRTNNSIYGTDRYADAYNINVGYSNTGLFAAPGLGNNFLDTYTDRTTTKAFTAQMSLSFVSTLDTSLQMTLAFGGRDDYGSNQSSLYTAWFRIIDTSANNLIVASGNTGSGNQSAMSYYYTPANPTLNLVGSAPSNAGVNYQAWEYYTVNWTGTAGHTYDLQVLMPEEINFDIAQGAQFTNIPGVTLPPIPEPSTYGLLGAGALLSLVAFRRKRRPRN